MTLKPNAFGVFPSSVSAINKQAAQQYLNPTANAAGAFGYDPITGAPITDKFAAMRFNDPGSAQPIASYLSSMPPLPPLPGGGGGGGGGRMGPCQDRKKIMNLGDRTSGEYVAKNGGLSAQRESTLDAAYQRGDITTGLPPLPTARRSKQPLPELPRGGYNVPLSMFDPPQEEPQPMAKGGPMKSGKPYLVGEEGPELILPRQDGSGYVIPADVTAQILPAMRPTPRRNGGPMSYTPRAEGGIMTLNTPNARFAGGATPYGPAYAMQQTEEQMGSPDLMNEQERELAQQMDQRMIVDNGYQVDLPALRTGRAQTIPLQPDVVTGPWASPAMPADTTGLQPYLQNQVSRLSMAGAKPVGRYPGQTFDDTSLKAILEYGNAMPGDTVEELEARTRQYQQGLRDPYAGSSGSGLTFEEMQQRMALRGMMYGDDYRDRQARNQTQADLAARAARVPLGTPTAPLPPLPGMPNLSPSTRKAIDRNQERFLRSPQGAQYAMEQEQQQQAASASAQAAGQWEMMTDPSSGKPFAMVNGRGQTINLPSIEADEKIIYREVKRPLYPDIPNSPETVDRVPVIYNSRTKSMRDIPLDSGTAETGGAQVDPAKPQSAPAPTGPVKVGSWDEARRTPKGTPFIGPDGKTYPNNK